MKKDPRISLVIGMIVFLLVFLSASCGKEEPSPMDVLSTDTLLEEPQPTSGPGFEEGDLPEDFPEDFPLPEDTRVGSSVNLGKGAFRTYLSLQGTLDEVLAFYHQELPAASWTIAGEGDSQGNPKMDVVSPEYQGEITFISGETGVVLEVYLFPPESAQEVPGIPENIGESTTLGSGESDFPDDFPLPVSFQPAQISSTLEEKGYQLAFSYQGLPELALADLTMALINGGWTVGDPSLEGNQRAYRVPFEDPATGFQGHALISNDPAVVGVESQNMTIIAFQSGE